MGIDDILFQVYMYLDCHYYCQPDMYEYPAPNKGKIQENYIHVLDPVNLLEMCGLYVLYISLGAIGNFIFLLVTVLQSLKFRSLFSKITFMCTYFASFA